MPQGFLTLLTLWPPFGTALGPPSGPQVPTVPVRDWTILEFLHETIEASNEFDGVYLTGLPEEWGRSAAECKACFLELLAFDEIDIWDDETNVSGPHNVEWRVTVIVRNPDPVLRDSECDRLSNVILNAVDSQSVNGIIIPGLTRLKWGKWERARPPERRAILTGQFTYLIHDFAGHDTTEST